ncbi:hypothetical protein [Cysteiniphilum sp. JM-1]|uniref:hypothetical protein n=1 Tax=Cysteiniphilum sp. JM-1 TaxID=2610891 RepID=UPI00124783C9|nr:hypothetical protein [Cysteiniphilum sp. JM-1]
MACVLSNKTLHNLQQHATKFSLSYLLEQLFMLGFDIKNIEFESVESSAFHTHTIAYLYYVDDKIIIGVNLGWLAAQSKLKDIGFSEDFLQSKTFAQYANQWLKHILMLLHLDLMVESKDAFNAITENNTLALNSYAELHYQVASLFPEYYFDLKVNHANSLVRPKQMILGQAILSDQHGQIGHVIFEAKNKIQITLNIEEGLSEYEIVRITQLLQAKWCAHYGSFWHGYLLQLHMRLLTNQESTYLSSRLTTTTKLNARQQLLFEQEL